MEDDGAGEADADQTRSLEPHDELAALEVNRVVDENASNLAEYGLAESAHQRRVQGRGRRAGELHLGDKTPTQSDIYAVKPGEKRVFLVPAFQETTFAKKPFDLRDKRVLNFERDKVDSHRDCTRPGRRRPAGASGSDWVVKQPLQARGDYSAIEGLLTRLATASMTEAGGAQQSRVDVGLDKPVGSVTLGAGSTRATLALGKEERAPCTRAIGRGSGLHGRSSARDRSQEAADEYRDKDLFEFRNFNVARLRVTRGADTYEFQKVAGTGENAATSGSASSTARPPMSTPKMDDFLAKLTALRAQSFDPTSKTAGLDKPTLVVAASYDASKFERVRLIAGEGQAFAVRDGEGGPPCSTRRLSEMIKALDAVVNPAPAPTS